MLVHKFTTEIINVAAVRNYIRNLTETAIKPNAPYVVFDDGKITVNVFLTNDVLHLEVYSYSKREKVLKSNVSDLTKLNAFVKTIVNLISTHKHKKELNI
jgi:hypothetical protein